MADHSVTVEIYYSGAWHAVPTYVRDGISLSRGARSEGQDSPPSSAALTLDNRTGAHSPKNPTSALYGLVGRNTPMRVSADGAVRSVTEVASWKPDRAVKGDSWTAVEGGGILRRIQQGTTALRPALERAILADSPVAFWPLNEPTGATQFTSGLSGGPPLTFRTAMRTGVVTGPAGADGVYPNLALDGGVGNYADGSYTATFGSTGWGLECVVYIGELTDPLVTSEYTLAVWDVTDSSNSWTLRAGNDDTDGPYVSVFGRVGTTNADVGFFTGLSVGWQHVRLLVFQDGADVKVQLWVNGTATDPVYGLASRTLAALTVNAPAGVIRVGTVLATETENIETLSAGLLAFYSIDDANDHYEAYTGYSGEAAGERFLRVCGEEGITADVVGTSTDTQLMGPQPVDTFVSILRECIRTDDGLLFEPVDDRALVMRTGRSRYNQDPALTLSMIAGHIAPGIAPVLDDQNARNDVTAARSSGGTGARAVKTSGPLNTSDPLDDPEGIGRVDTQITVNPSLDSTLVDLAHWHLHKGTVDEARFPQITIDLDAAPSLTATVDALDIGDRVDLTGLPTEWQPDDATLLILGIRESYPGGAGDYRRLVTLTTIPASPYEIGIVGANDGSTDVRGAAVDTDNSTLGSGITSTGTSLSVASTGGVVWTTDSDDWNLAQNGGGLFIVVGGEVMRITNITGASSPQTFTVSRSVNSVVKAHSAGASVRVQSPVVVGL